ncbi:MAG: hypothetical protein P1P84_02570 [Deferrisomatales bacterium]|nr:hypothetical protein [Deferrisomatales bacterium]
MAISSINQQKTRKLVTMLRKRLRDEGWETAFEFQQKSGQPYSPETIRKVFAGAANRRVEPTTYAVVMQYLNMTPPEIRDVLKTLTEDDCLWKLMPTEAGEAFPRTPSNEAWDSLRAKLSSNQDFVHAVLGVCRLAAVMLGVDIEAEVAVLSRKPTAPEG